MAESKVGELRVTPIERGIVIDHLPAGSFGYVLKILGIEPTENQNELSILSNAQSKIMKKKDIIKIAGKKDLTKKELDKISLVAPDATINYIQDSGVKEKYHVKVPDVIEDILRCPTSSCATNTPEPIKTRFRVIDRENKSLKLQCAYCDTILPYNEILKNIK